MQKQSRTLQCGTHSLSLDKPLIMGILNVTPDSFSDGGKFVTLDHAIQQALQMQENGAAIIDIGGESTRPGAESVTEDQELQRVIPIIEKLTAEIDAVISIDTSKAVVMYEAVQAGASMINDVYALRQPEALTKVAKLDVPVCLMHMQGQPRSMQKNIHYTNVVSDVCEFLLTRAGECEQAGVKPEQIILDPGFGFGKTLEHNYQLLNALHKIIELGYPVLAGLSRKSMLGTVTGNPADQRLAESLSAALLAAQYGASILRVHDVAETRNVLDIWQTVLDAE